MEMSEALYHGEVRNYIKKLRQKQVGFSNHLAKLTRDHRVDLPQIFTKSKIDVSRSLNMTVSGAMTMKHGTASKNTLELNHGNVADAIHT